MDSDPEDSDYILVGVLDVLVYLWIGIQQKKGE